MDGKMKIVFCDTAHGVRAYCPKCNAFAVEPFEYLGAPFVRCTACKFEAPTTVFEIQHERSHGSRPMPEYALKNISHNGIAHNAAPVPETDDDECDETDHAFDMTFPKTLVPQGIFGRLFDYYSSISDAPPQFHFVATLTTFSAIIGTRLKTKRRAVSIKAHDFFVVLTNSGQGKTTALEPCRELLTELERRIIDKPYHNVFTLPQVSTMRGLVDCVRCESEKEMREREALEQKGKPTPPPKQPQTSGALIIDEAAILFDSMRAEYNNGLDSIFLQIWDGNEKLFATSAKNDGRIKIPETAITLLGASTTKKFRDRLPRTAFEDGLVARLQVCFAPKREKPRMPLTAIIDENDLSRQTAIIDEMLSFFQFIADPQRCVSVIDSDGARELDAKSVERWFQESLSFTDEASCAYYQRLDLRKLRLALLFSACETYDRHGRLADNIIISESAMQKAIEVCDFFKRHTLHFIQQNDNYSEKGLDPIGRAKIKILKMLREKFNGEAKQRTLFQHSHIGKVVFETALNELLETKEVKKEKRPNANNLLVDWIVIPKHTATLATLQQNNATETQPKQQTEVKCSVATRSVASHFEKQSEAATPESKAVPEPMPPVPEPTNPEPTETVVPETSDVVKRILDELPANQIFTRQDILNACRKHAPNRVREVGAMLYPRYIVRLGTTDRFCFREHNLRPIEYRGLCDPNEDGIIPNDTEPF